MKATTTLLRIDSIVMDATTQCRVSLDEDAIAEYAERMKLGDDFPPVDAYGSCSKSYLADGWHRIEAAKKNGETEVKARLHRGSRTDAVKHALGANARNAVRRTNADKRRAVDIALKEFPNWSNRQIADQCLVSEGLVRKVEGQVRTVRTSDTRIGRDGKVYPATATKPEPAPSKQPESEPTAITEEEEFGPEPDFAVAIAESENDSEALNAAGPPVTPQDALPAPRHAVDTGKPSEPCMPPVSHDTATLSHCRSVVQRELVRIADEAAFHIIELLEGCKDEGDERHEAILKLVELIVVNLPEADADEPWWALEKAKPEVQRRVLKRAAEMLESYDSAVSGFDDMTVRDAYQIANNAVYVEKPLLENLLVEFTGSEDRSLVPQTVAA